MANKDKTARKQPEDWGEEPLFLTDDGPSDDLPTHITRTNIRELYGWQSGETLDEAMARTKVQGQQKD